MRKTCNFTRRRDASLGGEEQNLWIPPVLKELTTKNHIARKMQYRSFKVGPRRQRYFSIQTITKKRSIAIGGNYWRKYARKIIFDNDKMNFVWRCNENCEYNKIILYTVHFIIRSVEMFFIYALMIHIDSLIINYEAFI